MHQPQPPNLPPRNDYDKSTQHHFDALNSQQSLHLINSKLKKGEKFYFLRFSDGCFLMMLPEKLGEVVGRSNQFEVTESFQKELRESYAISDPNYLKGTVLGSGDWRTEINLPPAVMGKLPHTSTDQYVNSICLQDAMDAAATADIVTFLREVQRGENNIFVGTYMNRYIKYFYNIKRNIITRETNCHVDIDEIYAELLSLYNGEKGNILLSCGQTAKIIAKRAYVNGDFEHANFLDMGSFSDRLSIEDPSFEKVKMKRTSIDQKRLFFSLYRDHLLTELNRDNILGEQ